MGFYLREFGVQTTVIAAPVRWGGLLPAVLVPGPAGTHVAQTLRFSTAKKPHNGKRIFTKTIMIMRSWVLNGLVKQNE